VPDDDVEAFSDSVHLLDRGKKDGAANVAASLDEQPGEPRGHHLDLESSPTALVDSANLLGDGPNQGDLPSGLHLLRFDGVPAVY